MSVDPMEFVRARLDEDEATARDFEEGHAHAVNGDYGNEGRQTAATYWHGAEAIGMPPARMFREVEAKRRILRLIDRRVPGGGVRWLDVASTRDVMIAQALASSWSDHPDFDEAWR